MRKKVVLLTTLMILISFAHSFGRIPLQSGYSDHRGVSHVTRSSEEPGRFNLLRSLPGVGRATASAIAAFAFGRAHPFIETNIRAVFIHHFFRRRERVSDEEILPFVEQTFDRSDPRTWFYALMDRGAALKKTQTNPSRKSAHYTRQGRFEGSNRQARGMIVRALVDRPLSENQLAAAMGLEPAMLRGLVRQLERDGMIVMRRGKLRIA